VSSEHGASCFCGACTSAAERVESDETLVGEFDQLVMNSLYLIDQGAIAIVMIFTFGEAGYTWGGCGICVFLLALSLFCSPVTVPG
jgi:hypothetical protein